MRAPRNFSHSVLVSEEGRNRRVRLDGRDHRLARGGGRHAEVVDSDAPVNGSGRDEVRVILVPVEGEDFGGVRRERDGRGGELAGASGAERGAGVPDLQESVGRTRGEGGGLRWGEDGGVDAGGVCGDGEEGRGSIWSPLRSGVGA